MKRSIHVFVFLVMVLAGPGCAAGAREGAARGCVAAGAPFQVMPLATLRGGLAQTDPFTRVPPPERIINLLQPVQVAVTANDVFIADLGRRELLRADRAQQTFSRFAPLPPRAGGVAVDRWSSVYVTEPAQRRVAEYRRDGSPAQVYTDVTSLSNPVDVAIGPSDRVYVADAGGARVVVFNRLGQVVQLIGEKAGRPNPFRSVAALAAGPEGLYVLDPLARQVHALTFEGESRFSFGESSLRLPVSLAVDRFERVFVADQADNTIRVFEPKQTGGTLGRRIEGVRFQRLNDVWVDDTGLLYVADAVAGVSMLRVPPPCP
ncbi:MAG TPA: NHL repeat-containing protein [Sulfuricaulis sp.]|nr:NHL repeat-containing protein [Sulfuricaulis sp.]